MLNVVMTKMSKKYNKKMQLDAKGGEVENYENNKKNSEK